MTILTKPDILISKLNVAKSPLINEEKVDSESLEPEFSKDRRCSTYLLMAMVSFTLVATMAVVVASVVYHDSARAPEPVAFNFRGFCSLKFPKDDFGEYGNDNLPFLSESLVQPEFSKLEMQLISISDEVDTAKTLKEKLHIDNIDNIEEITVIMDNGENFDFVHDFNNNISGIVEAPRCYVMQLDPEAVLPPAQFSEHIAQGAPFDVSPVSAVLRALLPPLHTALLGERCAGRPVYRLDRGDEVPVRKRRSAATHPQYRHFSGKHVQHIAIQNLDEVLDYEKGKA